MTRNGFFWFAICVSVIAGLIAMFVANLVTGGPGVSVPSIGQTGFQGAASAGAMFLLLYWVRLGGS